MNLDKRRDPKLPATKEDRMRFLKLLKQAAIKWDADAAPRLGSALAYYSLFSIGPLLLIAVSIAGLIFGKEAVNGELSTQLTGLLGRQGAEAVSTLLAGTHEPEAAGFAGAIGVLTLLFGATSVIVQLKDALNVIWAVHPKPGRGLRLFFRKYVASLAAIMGFGFLLMISLVVSTAVSGVGRYASSLLPLPELALQAADFAVSFTIFTLMIAGIFKFLPDVYLRFRDVLPGAALTSVLFLVGKTLIGLYLGKQGIGSTFGAAGSVVIILIWVYYSAQIVFFGAEFTAVYCRERGVKIVATKDAEIVQMRDGLVVPASAPVPETATSPAPAT